MREIVQVKADLLTLMIRDLGLRSALIGCLSMLGESILSMEGAFDDPAIRRRARPPAILIADLESLDGRLDELLAMRYWKGIIVIAEAAAPLDDDQVRNQVRDQVRDQVRMVGLSDALSRVVETLADWRRDPRPIQAG